MFHNKLIKSGWNNLNMKLTSLIILFLLFASSFVNAGLGVARDNLPGDVIKIHPGDSTWYGMRIQNSGNKDVTVSVLVTGGEDILQVVSPQETYLIPANSHDTEIRLNIRIPSYAIRGTEYPIKVFIGSSTDVTGGMVSMVGAVSFDMTVKVAGALEVATLIKRRDLAEQIYPCLIDSDCPKLWGCHEEKQTCYVLPPPDVLNADFGKVAATNPIFVVLAVFILSVVALYIFRDSDFVWDLRQDAERFIDDVIWEIKYRLRW